MPISYPLALPTSIGIANITLSANNAVAISQSPFTFQQQIIQHPGQRWTASVNIPPVRRELAEPWNAFLLALNGPVGTFLLGDPNARNPRGSALGFRKNLFTWSEQSDNAAWAKFNGTTAANVAIAPDNNLTADNFIENTANGEHYVDRSFSVTAGQVYTFSTHVKDLSGTRRFRLRTAVNAGANSIDLNFQTGAVVSSGDTSQVSFGSVALPNGWFRLWITITATGTGTAVFRHQLITTSTVYTGDGTSGIYIWGAQLEEGSLTDYQPITESYGPFVSGAGQTGSSLSVDGASPSETGYLLAGDYIQLGSGATASLHKVLQDVETNEAGQATIDIWPRIRTSPADNATVTLENTVGLFRLSGTQQSFSIDEASFYGISFDCVEAL